MSRIPTAPTIDTAPATTRPLLERVEQQLGSVPNLFRMLANSPAALVAANRRGESHDAKADAAVRFAVAVLWARGHVGEASLQAVRAAGYDDAQVLEIVLHVVLNVLTNYVNEVAQTDIDFPPVDLRKAS